MTRWLIAAALIAAAPLAAADEHFGPTLAHIAGTGVFRIGYVPDAPPMSFVDANGKTVGYSIDLCRHIGDAVAKRLNRTDLKTEFVPLVAPQERIDAIVNSKVDIECGATTVTLSRRKAVDFTLMTFITGGTVLSRKNNPVPTLESLPGKRIAVIKGTTTEDALLRFGRLNDYRFTLALISTHDEGMRLLNEGKVDGYASDRAMLIGQVFRTPGAADYVMARQVFSREPYSLMTRRGDTEFRLLADSALADLYSDARIRRLYHNWFGRYGEPLSPVVEAMYELQAVSE
jgi:glutamate/aspartate transport system substrate-binding protein